MNTGSFETEVKLRVEEADSARSLIEQHGFRVSRERVFEANTIYDTSGGRLRSAGELLRLRQVGSTGVVTFKGKTEPGKHKTRPEYETEVTDPATMAKILECSGFRPVFRYEKYRTEFDRGDAQGVIVLDETPIGVYLELEGESEWIDATARELGFAESTYITASYGRLYTDYCRSTGKQAGDMIFGEPAGPAV